MASVVSIKIGYTDGSKSYTEDFTCADTHPSPEVIKELERAAWQKWEDMGNTRRGTSMGIRVKK